MERNASGAAPDGPQRLSMVAATLEAAYQELVGRWPELPPVAITIYRDTRRRNVLGYFWDGQWHCAGGELPELHISSTLLDEPASMILCVLVHEAVHARAAGLGIQDTSRRGRYHNGRFAKLAQEMGLELSYDPTRGYHTPAVQQAWLDGPYQTMLGRLERVAGLLWQEPEPGRQAGSTQQDRPGQASIVNAGRLLKAICPCQPPRILRVARTTFEEAPLICGACWQPFALDV